MTTRTRTKKGPGGVAVITDRDLGYKGFLTGVKNLSLLPGVFVGVRSSAGGELLVIAASNEFGTADGHVPERSYLRSTIDEKRDDYEAALAKIVGATVDGKGILRLALERLGAKAVGDVQRKIVAIRYPRNADSTIAQKGVDNPLIDTGRLRQSIDYDVRKGAGGVA